MKIYNNFLPKENFEGIKKIMTGPDFPWFFNNEVLSLPGKNPHFQFVHTFYLRDKENSNLLEFLAPTITKFKLEFSISILIMDILNLKMVKKLKVKKTHLLNLKQMNYIQVLPVQTKNEE